MFVKSIQLQKKIEEKTKKFAKKHEAILFLITRIFVYIYIANMTISIHVPRDADLTTTIIIYAEAINYLIILGIVFLFPTLSDFNLVKN